MIGVDGIKFCFSVVWLQQEFAHRLALKGVFVWMDSVVVEVALKERTVQQEVCCTVIVHKCLEVLCDAEFADEQKSKC